MLIPGAPLIMITMFVQVVAVTLLPAALVFLILLLNDKPLMGQYVNTRWQNVANMDHSAVCHIDVGAVRCFGDVPRSVQGWFLGDSHARLAE